MKQRGWVVLWNADGVEHDALLKEETPARNFGIRQHAIAVRELYELTEEEKAVLQERPHRRFDEHQRTR